MQCKTKQWEYTRYCGAWNLETWVRHVLCLWTSGPVSLCCLSASLSEQELGSKLPAVCPHDSSYFCLPFAWSLSPAQHLEVWMHTSWYRLSLRQRILLVTKVISLLTTNHPGMESALIWKVNTLEIVHRLEWDKKCVWALWLVECKCNYWITHAFWLLSHRMKSMNPGRFQGHSVFLYPREYGTKC